MRFEAEILNGELVMRINGESIATPEPIGAGDPREVLSAVAVSAQNWLDYYGYVRHGSEIDAAGT